MLPSIYLSAPKRISEVLGCAVNVLCVRIEWLKSDVALQKRSSSQGGLTPGHHQRMLVEVVNVFALFFLL
jgi:hypothetical protein